MKTKLLLLKTSNYFIQDGEEGSEGPAGKPGKDAEYCPCPPRDGSGGKRGGSKSDAGVSGGNYGRRRAVLVQ